MNSSFDNESTVSKETLFPESTAQILLSAAWSKTDTVRRKRTISVVLILQTPMPFDLLFVPSLCSITYTGCNLFSSQFAYLCWAITQSTVMFPCNYWSMICLLSKDGICVCFYCTVWMSNHLFLVFFKSTSEPLIAKFVQWLEHNFWLTSDLFPFRFRLEAVRDSSAAYAVAFNGYCYSIHTN